MCVCVCVCVLKKAIVCTCGLEILICCFASSVFSVEWSTSMDVVLLKLDPLSDNVAAFTKQDGNTDCKF